jgi:hypothetical protein
VSLRDALRDAIPYLDAAAARSSALSGEAMMPKEIADTFRAWTGDDPLAGVRDFRTVVDNDWMLERITTLETREAALRKALRNFIEAAEHTHRMGRPTAALDQAMYHAREAIAGPSERLKGLSGADAEAEPTQRPPNGQ